MVGTRTLALNTYLKSTVFQVVYQVTNVAGLAAICQLFWGFFFLAASTRINTLTCSSSCFSALYQTALQLPLIPRQKTPFT